MHPHRHAGAGPVRLGRSSGPSPAIRTSQTFRAGACSPPPPAPRARRPRGRLSAGPGGFPRRRSGARHACPSVHSCSPLEAGGLPALLRPDPLHRRSCLPAQARTGRRRRPGMSCAALRSRHLPSAPVLERPKSSRAFSSCSSQGGRAKHVQWLKAAIFMGSQMAGSPPAKDSQDSPRPLPAPFPPPAGHRLPRRWPHAPPASCRRDSPVQPLQAQALQQASPSPGRKEAERPPRRRQPAFASGAVLRTLHADAIQERSRIASVLLRLP